MTVVAQTFSDGDGVARLDLDGVVVSARPAGRRRRTAPADQRLRQLLVLAGSAEQLGITEGALKLTSSYAKTREQFGRPIGTFQAVSQRLADGYIDVLGQRLTLWQAAWRLDEGLPADSEVAIAKLWAADAGHRLAHTTVHVHGGVGIDLDGEAHRYFTSAKRFEFLHGGATEQALNVGRILAAEPGLTRCLPETVRDQLLRARGRRPRRAAVRGPDLDLGRGPCASRACRASRAGRRCPTRTRPPHVGVLLENVPEFAFLLGGAALGGQVVVGLNPTRRGEALAADVRRADCQVVSPTRRTPTCSTGSTWPASRCSPSTARTGRRGSRSTPAPLRRTAEVGARTLLMLIFTSGTCGRAQGGQRDPGEGRVPGPIPVRAVRSRPTTSLPVDADVPLQRDHGRLGSRSAAGATMVLARGSPPPASCPTYGGTARRTRTTSASR